MKETKEKSEMPCIIFSNNRSFAYKVRLKLSDLGIKSQYKNKFLHLLDFIIENEEGLVIISTKSRLCQKYLERYARSQAGRNISFVFLKNDVEVSVATDNQFSFITTYEQLQEQLPVILAKSSTRKYQTPTILPEQIDKCLTIVLKSFRVSTQHLGYYYVKDCVQLLSGDKKDQFRTIKEVYKIIANKYSKLTSSIEKSIRVCIQKSYKKANDIYDSVFSTEKLSNLSFINFLVEKTKQMNTTLSAS